ncbi:Multidrug resistance-associated protein 1, partial [Zancudomyces culisetae]
MLQFPIFIVPMTIVSMVETTVSGKRIVELLRSEELQRDAVERLEYPASDAQNTEVVSITSGNFTWGKLLMGKTDRDDDDDGGEKSKTGDGGKAENEKSNDSGKKKKSEKGKKNKKGKSEADDSSDIMETEADKVTLSDINFVCNKGQLVSVVGRVGSGKSSLVSAMLGDMKKLSGKVTVRGRVAYVPQQPWIINATLRENILFGHKYDEDFYRKVVKTCELEKDIEMLKGGDMAEIGENGINLSGGQKARVSLARAVYSKAQLFLFDDPLSAVDAHVGRNLMKNVIGPSGLLKNRTRILVTHALQYLPVCDNIYAMKDGVIVESGTYSELIADSQGFLSVFMGGVDGLTTQGQENMDSETSSNVDISTDASSKDVDGAPGAEPDYTEIVRRISMKKRLSIGSLGSYAGLNILQQLEDDDDDDDEGSSTTKDKMVVTKQQKPAGESSSEETKDEGALIQSEESEKGNVKLSVFWSYIKASSISGMLLYVIFAVAKSGFMVGASLWLKQWSNNNSLSQSMQSGHSKTYYLLIYGLLGFLQAISYSLENLIIWVVCAIRAARSTHNGLLNGVMRSPMSFFDTTPTGRILNRFNKDQDSIDRSIPRAFDMWIQSMISVITSLLVIMGSFWMFAIAAAIILIVYAYIQRYFVTSSRELKRLESTTRSPIYAHFQESLSGMSSIRSYDQADRFLAQNRLFLESNTRASFPFISLNRWLSIRLELMGACIIFMASFFSVLSTYLSLSFISASLVGLAVSYSLDITQRLSWGVRQAVELETSIISIERNLEYANLPPEAPESIPDTKPPKDWPQHGKITFNNYSTRYRPGLDLVLRDINLTIEPSTRVGVVGRTGAGKSSLTLTLFRIIEAAAGSIQIDGVDISKLGLHDLRSKLVIIPQDPVLFGGTLRENLDPFSQYTDAEIWIALEHAQLKPWVLDYGKTSASNNAGSSSSSVASDAQPTITSNSATSSNVGLNLQIQNNGSNLSLGQRQLVCLARALLRSPLKILVLDEATAAIDVETDRMIQQAIRSEQFSDCTVITIAHRLNTIMDSDKILVIDAGQIA